MRDFKTFYVKIASLSQRIYNSDDEIILALLYQHTDEILLNKVKKLRKTI